MGSLLFLIFINDLDDGISDIILKFADDTTLIGKVGRVDEIEKLRGDLKKLDAWSKEWQMVLNADRCKVLHFGYNLGRFIMLWMVIFLNLLRKNEIYGQLFKGISKWISSVQKQLKLPKVYCFFY